MGKHLDRRGHGTAGGHGKTAARGLQLFEHVLNSGKNAAFINAARVGVNALNGHAFHGQFPVTAEKLREALDDGGAEHKSELAPRHLTADFLQCVLDGVVHAFGGIGERPVEVKDDVVEGWLHVWFLRIMP